MTPKDIPVKDRLIFAMDVSGCDQARKLVDELGDAVTFYKIGLELFRDIEERWDKGQFGEEWNACDDFRQRSNWNRHLGLGREKIFEVRKLHNDVTFIDEFLTPAMIDRLDLYNYRFDPKRGQWVIDSRDPEKVRERLLFQLTNSGQPVVVVEDANYRNRGELLLAHRTDQTGWTRATPNVLSRMYLQSGNGRSIFAPSIIGVRPSSGPMTVRVLGQKRVDVY